MQRFRLLLLAACLLLGSSTGLAQEKVAESAENAGDEQLLKSAGVGLNVAELRAFFQKRTLSEADLARLQTMVRELGDPSFTVREKASQRLREYGRPAVFYLERALTDPDLEIAYRARRCLDDLANGSETSLVLAAARVLTRTDPRAATSALLGYIPFAGDIEDSVLSMLTEAAARAGATPHPALVEALKDRQTERRAAAALILGGARDANRRVEVRTLLADAQPKVRLRAAQGLITAREKEAVPTLIALLEDASVAEALQAEELLCRLAGEHSPKLSVGTGIPEDRRKCREAWTSWWRTEGPKLDLTHLELEERLIGLTLVVAYDGYNQGKGRVFEIGPDGKTRWQIDDVQGPVDAQVLPGNRVLIAEYNAVRFSERSRDGKIVWEHRANGSPVNCRRLPNGNTFLATTSEISEMTPAGKTLYTISGRQVYSAYKLRNGNIIYLSVDGSLIELDVSGKEVRKFKACNTPIGLVKIAVLPAGRFLVPEQTQGKLKEFDMSGKVLWEGKAPNSRVVVRLPNGNSLLCCHNGDHRVVEVNREGRIVWEQKLEGHAHFASRR
jgi:HEAT repeat protein